MGYILKGNMPQYAMAISLWIIMSISLVFNMISKKNTDGAVM